MAVIDISGSSLSAHQVGETGYYSSHNKRDPHINMQVTGGFDFTRGLITCAQLKTRTIDGKVKLLRRSKYGMCGAGHWVRRSKDRYGAEEEKEFDAQEWREYTKKKLK